MPPSFGEFAIIERYFAPLALGEPGALGLRDDAALVELVAGQTLVVTTDAIVAGIHFTADADAEQVAAKLLGVNLSDLAAMGARPRAYLLVAALPQAWQPAELQVWLERFAGRLAADQARYGLRLLGGDTVATPGPLSLTMTAIGTVDAGRAVRRSTAEVGDCVYVSGTVGDAALGLLDQTGGLDHLDATHRRFLADRLQVPRPRLELGARLFGLASAAADVSDGLVADLERICAASGVDAAIDVDRVPLSPAGTAAIGGDSARLAVALSGGDDYELVFTAPGATDAALANIADELGVPITRIGRISPSAGGDRHVFATRGGAPFELQASGWQHFR